MTFYSIPRCFDGDTVVVVGGGPSLTSEQVALARRAQARGRCRIVAINKAFTLFPEADWLWGTG